MSSTSPAVMLHIFDLDDTLTLDGAPLDEACLHVSALAVLSYLKSQNHSLAVASHNPCALERLRFNNILRYFDVVNTTQCKMDESYGKRRQVEEILEWYNQNKKDRNFSKKDVTFYDDLYEVVTDLRKWGVNCKLVDWQTGVQMSDIVESWAVETPQTQSSGEMKTEES